MRLAFYDPKPFRNEYVSMMFLRAMRKYAAKQGIAWKDTDHLVPEKGWDLICDADYLRPEVVRHFHANHCRISGISCIDSAYISSVIQREPELELVHRVFMVSGVPRSNVSHATVVDSDFQVRAEPREYLPAEHWARFDRMRLEGRILPLPYVPWTRLPEVGPPLNYTERRRTIMFRGGNHFLRFIAYLFALQKNAADPRSGFHSRFYFADDMNPQFRYCGPCREVFKANGRRFPRGSGIGPAQCQSQAPWGAALDFSVPGYWNNRCPQSFYWLSEQFAERHGAIDMGAVEAALNHHNEQPDTHLRAIGEALLYAEAKWEFSINMPQRFWEGAAVGTVNYLPERANDQEYFPALHAGEHYLTFRDDFSNISAEMDVEKWSWISERAHRAFVDYIQPTDHQINSNLLAYIFQNLA